MKLLEPAPVTHRLSNVHPEDTHVQVADVYSQPGDIYHPSLLWFGNAGLADWYGQCQPLAHGRIFVETKNYERFLIDQGVLIDVNESVRNAHYNEPAAARLILGAGPLAVGGKLVYKYLDPEGEVAIGAINKITSFAVAANENPYTKRDADAARLPTYHEFGLAESHLREFARVEPNKIVRQALGEQSLTASAFTATLN